MSIGQAPVARRGRGATFDPANRFAPRVSVAEEDGRWLGYRQDHREPLDCSGFRPPRAQGNLFT